VKPERIARLLPAVYQEAMPVGPDAETDSILAAALSVMEAMHLSTEGFLLDHTKFIDPLRAEPKFLAALAGWVGLGPYLERMAGGPIATADLRELTRRAASLARSRGTAESIIAICELVTGLDGFAIEEGVTGEDGRPIPFHFRLRAPAAARSRREALERILRLEKPCFVTAEIVFADTTEESHAELPDR
jgi:hypothetical protein